MSNRKKTKKESRFILNWKLFMIILILVMLILCVGIYNATAPEKYSKEYFEKKALRYIKQKYGFKSTILNCNITYDDDYAGEMFPTETRKYNCMCKMKKGNKNFNLTISEYTTKESFSNKYKTTKGPIIKDNYQCNEIRRYVKKYIKKITKDNYYNLDTSAFKSTMLDTYFNGKNLNAILDELYKDDYNSIYDESDNTYIPSKGILVEYVGNIEIYPKNVESSYNNYGIVVAQYDSLDDYKKENNHTYYNFVKSDKLNVKSYIDSFGSYYKKVEKDDFIFIQRASKVGDNGLITSFDKISTNEFDNIIIDGQKYTKVTDAYEIRYKKISSLAGYNNRLYFKNNYNDISNLYIINNCIGNNSNGMDPYKVKKAKTNNYVELQLNTGCEAERFVVAIKN